MKALSTFLLFCCFLPAALAQVSGKASAPDAQPIPYANVLLRHAADSTLAKGTLTDDAGAFTLAGVVSGHYFLSLSMMGYQSWHSPVFELNTSASSKDFGTVVLETSWNEMDAVVIQGEKPLYQQEIDRTTVNVENSVLTKGSSALQVLERAPGVMIDHRNSSIALNGKNGVMLMLNGKLMRLPMSQLVTLLNSMSADNIEKIELLTTPPAKYDAEGSAGMINIVLKRNEEYGTQGSFALTAGYGWAEKAGASANLSHHRAHTHLHGSYAYTHDRSYNEWFATSSQNMPAMGGALNVDFWHREKPRSNNHNATLAFDTNLSPTVTLGSSITYNHSLLATDIFNRGGYASQPDSFLLMHTDIASTNRWKNINSNLYLEKRMQQGDKITFDLEYLYYKNSSPSDIRTSFFNRSHQEVMPGGSLFSTRQRGLASTPIQVGVVKADFIKQLRENVHMEAGIKGTYTRSSSTSDIESLMEGAWVGSPRTSSNRLLTEGIGAAYTSFQVQANPSTRLVAGARYEYSNTHMDAEKEENKIDRRFGKLFPSLFVSHKLSEKAELQFSYTKRISRPSYNDMASSMLYIDPMAVFTGNPLLKPVITHNLKAGYNYQGYTFSLLFSKDLHPIAYYQLTEAPAGDIMYVAPQNLQYQNNLDFQTSLPFKINKWWNMNYGFVGGLREFKLAHTKEKFQKTYFGFSAHGSQTFELPRSFFLELSGWYNSMSYNGSVEVEGFGSLNAGIKKELKNNWGSLQLSVADLFKSMNINSYFGQLTEEAYALSSHVSYNAESRKSRIIRLTYSKSFGNSQLKNQREQRSGTEEERSRVRK